MIPPDLKVVIASHALLAPLHSPTLLEIPSSFTLLHLSTLPAEHPGNVQNQLSISNTLQTRNDIAEAIQAAINTSLSPIDGTSTDQSERRSFIYSETNVSMALSLTTIPRQLPTSMIPFQFDNHLCSLLSNSKPHRPLSPSLPRLLNIGNLYLSSCPGKKGMFPHQT